MNDRMQFSVGSLRKIAAETGFSVSTISRELLRIAQEDGKFMASATEVRARGRRRQSNRVGPAICDGLRKCLCGCGLRVAGATCPR